MDSGNDPVSQGGIDFFGGVSRADDLVLNDFDIDQPLPDQCRRH
jgi:hypothetical protein